MIEVEIEDDAWTAALPDAGAVAQRAATAALGCVEGDVVVLLTDDAAVRDLNARFRDKDRPTNVLSFPAAGSAAPHLGDLVLAFGVCAAEAEAQGKTLADHLSHLTVHGVLHLLGRDHEAEDEAVTMEGEERSILASLGVADPYRRAMTHPTATLESDGSRDGPRARLILRFGRIGLALAAGAAAALAHPPFGVLPGLLGYALLMVLAERSAGARGAFWVGWLAGFAYFFISCWWVAEAFLVNPAQAWMAPFAASLLPVGLGLFWGTATALYRRFMPGGVRRVLVFAALFCLLEWLRGHVLTGFPWNPAGASWKAGSAASQFAAVAGVYGLGFVTVAGAAAFAPLLGAGSRKARIGVAVLGAAALGALVVGGAVRLSQARLALTDTVVRIVQADVPQESKWSPEAYRGIVDRYVNLTARPGAVVPDLIIWPEGALPASANQVFAPGSPDAEAIARAVQPGQSLIMGLGRGVPDPAAPEGGRYYNSLFVLTDEGAGGLRITATYDKYRLVPFGEYLPAGGIMSALGVRSLTHMPTDFSAGPRPAPIDIPGAPRAQPLICYESLYPGFTPGGAGRPGWIVNISNDAWFGRTSGPQQHLNLASYRAIETGLPVVRSTPTGVSAMIDPWGRVVGDQRLEPGESGVIDARLPQPTRLTPYGRFGDLPFWLAVLAGLALAGPWSRLRRGSNA